MSDFLIMLEQQRIEYLQAMGIQLWMPRQPLAHAADSLWLVGDESSANTEEVDGVKFRGGHAADLLADMDFTTSGSKPASQNPNQNNSQNNNQSISTESTATQVERVPVTANPANTNIEEGNALVADSGQADRIDLTIPEFELHFALWPCGILWVASQPFDQHDHMFQTSVSYSLLISTVPQASYSQFKWPYIKGSSEDQSTAVALRALTAQWDFMSSQGARAWVAVDSSSLEWLSKVAVRPLYAVDDKDELYSLVGKKQLWNALKTLPNIAVS